MIPLKMRRLFFGFTPRRLLGINGSILAHCPSLNQNKFARICWPPDSVDQPVESQHGQLGLNPSDEFSALRVERHGTLMVLDRVPQSARWRRHGIIGAN